MRNPWLDINAADYIGHMSSPEVDQLSVLSRLLRDALERCRPRDLLVVGCGTGNGLVHVDPGVTRRVTGVDVNPEYLAIAVAQLAGRGFELELHCADVMTHAFPADAFDLVHGALLFEYVDWRRLMPEMSRTTRVGGILSLVLQRPSEASPPVTRTAFESLQRLDGLFHFVDPAEVVACARAGGFEIAAQRVEALRSRKAFEVLHLRKVSRPTH
jgi:SAM-dependent methyltransferase